MLNSELVGQNYLTLAGQTGRIYAVSEPRSDVRSSARGSRKGIPLLGVAGGELTPCLLVAGNELNLCLGVASGRVASLSRGKLLPTPSKGIS